MNREAIFNITSEEEFEETSIGLFRYQYEHNNVYREFCDYLGTDPLQVTKHSAIPFLPIQFFKSHKVVSGNSKPDRIFTSSGTTGSQTSKHYVSDIKHYEKSYLKAFGQFYGAIEEYTVLALLPSYLEREGSSLIYMVNDLIERSSQPDSGFYLNDLEALKNTLLRLEKQAKKTLLIGVSFALLDFVESFKLKLRHTIIMETGGMKGRRKELIRQELHQQLCEGFGVNEIHSEYGMTELLSQAYSKGDGIFDCPPWMRISTRDTEDALSLQPYGRTGGINITDLANIDSCAFIATQDLGKVYEDGSFEILGRFDHSDIRGCNLMLL
ncbi:acyl transferase [Leptobacterium flavescens]|uniref:Acyl transferase n=1 Tax=Leptobacterium flavescens TaxID=472055 RepID=A0A6P0UQ25_9FLAO|nr:acyl transferase [Leptobacterium flavescens]NER14612.1 acyl transferase [Leptobacterium flavescens]